MRLSEVIWKCRKGIREVDILLSRYTEKFYPHPSEEDKKIYVEFIDQDTYAILDVLVNDKKPENEKFIKIVEALKSFN